MFLHLFHAYLIALRVAQSVAFSDDRIYYVMYVLHKKHSITCIYMRTQVSPFVYSYLIFLYIFVQIVNVCLSAMTLQSIHQANYQCIKFVLTFQIALIFNIRNSIYVAVTIFHILILPPISLSI